MCLSFLTSVNSLAQDVIILDKGETAPFHGYLFPDDKAIQFRKDLIELDGLKKMESSYQKSLDLFNKNETLYNTKVNMLLEQNDKLAVALYKSKDRDAFENRFWFILGMIVTGSGVYLATKIK